MIKRRNWASQHPKVTGSSAESAKALRLCRGDEQPDVTIRERRQAVQSVLMMWETARS